MFNKSKRKSGSKGSNGSNGSNDEFSPVSTIIGPDVLFTSGIFQGSGSVSLHGKLECAVQVSGSIRIEEDGVITGDVCATEVIVEGKVKGDIAATHCTITETGEVLGNVTCAKLSVAEGGLFGGRCEMQKDYAPSLKPSNEGQTRPALKFPEGKNISNRVTGAEAGAPVTV